jgi:hypothetical protein
MRRDADAVEAEDVPQASAAVRHRVAALIMD